MTTLERHLGWSSLNEGMYSPGQRALVFGGHFNNVIGKIPVIHCHDFYTGTSYPLTSAMHLRSAGFTDDAFAIASSALQPVVSATFGGGSTFGIDSVVVTGGEIDDLIAWSASAFAWTPPFRTRSDKVCLIADGTGCLDALNWAWRNQSKVLALILRAPVVALDAYHDRNAGGQATAIETAYGGLAAYNAALPTHDPMQNLDLIRLFAHRIRLWVGDNDSLIPDEEVSAFAALVGAEVTVLDGYSHSQTITGAPIGPQVDWLVRKVQERQEFVEGWYTGDWTRFTRTLFTTGAAQSDFEYSVVTNTMRGDITYLPGLANNYREFWLANDFSAVDSEVFSLWHSGDPLMAGQQGHVHRYVSDEVAGTFTTHMFWHDIFFGVPWIMNIAVIAGELDGSAFTFEDPQGGGEIQGLRLAYGGTILGSSRTSNIVDLVVDLNSDRVPAVGDFISVTGLTGLPIGNPQLIAVDLPHLYYSDPGADVASGGSGTFGNVTRGFPYFVRSQVTGNPPGMTLRVKAWPPHLAEPEWGDPAWGFVIEPGSIPTTNGALTYGRSGLFLGHVQNVRFGRVEVTEL